MTISAYAISDLETCQMFTTAREAREAGARFFWNGRPCRAGHVGPRYTAGGDCVACRVIRGATPEKRAYDARWNQEHRVERAASNAQWHRDQRVEYSERAEWWRQKYLITDPEACRAFATPKLAREAGAKFYFTGRPCPAGHIGPRLTLGSGCLACVPAYSARSHRIHQKKRNAYCALYDRTHRIERNAYNKQWHRENPECMAWHAARLRAKRLGVPFTITEADLHLPTHCEAWGTLLIPNYGRRGPGPDSCTIDRVIPLRGYIPENLGYLCSRANLLKRNHSLTALNQIVADLSAFTTGRRAVTVRETKLCEARLKAATLTEWKLLAAYVKCRTPQDDAPLLVIDTPSLLTPTTEAIA